jgi:hypothetical protein
MQSPDYISPFTAYRTWHWEPFGFGIRSLNDTAWKSGEAHVAKCNRGRDGGFPTLPSKIDYSYLHPVPNESCTCGIYAAKHWKHLIEIGYGGYGIHGEVALWGTIEECRLGYRAQYAYPKFFCVPPNMLTVGMKDTEERMEALIAYNVDIFVMVNNKPLPDVQKVPLWVKDFGYSAQGIDFLKNYIQRIYSFKDDRAEDDPEVGERLCIKNVGIAVVSAVTKTFPQEVTITLFNQTVHRIPREAIRWHSRNNRWESDTTGTSTALSRTAARGF